MKLGEAGLRVDPERNAGAVGADGRISSDDATVAAFAVAVDEERVIAEETLTCLSERRP